MNPPLLTSIAPFFIVQDVPGAVAFYRDRLGFEATFLAPEDEPFFASIQRDGVRLMLKAILPEVPPQPNPRRHPWARWDAFVHTPDPDALAADLTSRGLAPHPFRHHRGKPARLRSDTVLLLQGSLTPVLPVDGQPFLVRCPSPNSPAMAA